MPRVDIYADAFSQSYLVQQGVHDFFVSVLHFWVKACKFYRRRAIWNFMRSTWNDYNLEFSRLEISTTSAIDRIEKGALAEHIKDSKVFMSDQRQRNDMQNIGLEEQSDLHRIFAPLLPPNEDMNFYVRDHETARQKRHPNTCEWILRHPKFLNWSKIPANKGSKLWINAGPGTGKTVLTSFIIDHFLGSETRYERPTLLYFYFRESSLHNNNATAATCSIAFQLHRQQEKLRNGIEMNAKAIYGSDRDETRSGFPEVWRLLSMFLEDHPNLVLILDALDECEDISLLLPRLLDLATRGNITLLLTGRRQKHLVRYLDGVEILDVTAEDVHQDIKAFVEFKVTRNPRLSHSLVRNTVMERVLTQHNGMFLWVSLMLKELKACITVEEVQVTLGQIPSGLEGIYKRIVERLGKSLTRRAAEVTRSILSWVLGSARTLTMDELRDALAFRYQAQGHTLLSDGEFPYADKDIEDMCGSLISIWHGQIQTVHHSTKEYLVGLGENRQIGQGLEILPTSVDISQQLASICLTYQEKICTSSLANLQIDPFDRHPDGFDINILKDKKKFLEYSFFFWIHHVLGCPINHRESMVAIILRHFSNSMTISWVVVSMLLDFRGLWRLIIGVEEVEEWLVAENPHESMSEAARYLQDWCSGTVRLLKAHSILLLENPWNIWTLDLSAFLDLEQRFAVPSNCIYRTKEIEKSLESSTGQANSSQWSPINPKLGHNQWSLLKARLGFFLHDQNQNIFLSGEQRTSEEGECLFVQHAESGQRLSPATAGLAAVLPDEKYRYGYVITAKISVGGKYLAVAYNKWLSIWAIKPNLKFSHRLRNRAWAFRLVSEKYHEKQPEGMAAGMIAFAGDDRLYAPGGWYELATKEFHAFQSAPSVQPTEAHNICYSGNGSYLFTRNQNDSSKIVSRQSVTPIGLASSVSIELHMHSARSIKSSNTGKYLILFDDKLRGWTNVEGSSRMTLFNVTSMEKEHFPGLEGFFSFGECSFHFSEEDETLLTFLWEPSTQRGVHAMMTVTVWGMGSGKPKLLSQGQIWTVVAAHPATIINPPIVTITAQDLAWIVSCDRTVQIVRYTTEGVFFPGYEPLANQPSVVHSQVSLDGYRLGIVRIAGTKVHIEVNNLLPCLQEDFKLERTCPDIEQLHPICLSPKLDLFVLGGFVWTFDTETNELAPPIECDINLSTPARDWDWECTISSCGEFVAFDKPAYKHYMDFHDRQLGRSVIFRINRRERTAIRVTIPFAQDVQAASPDFHPFLPQAALSTSKGEGSDNNQTSFREPRIPSNELTLSMIHLNKDEVVPLDPVQLTHLVRSKLYFADTGDFLLLEGLQEARAWPQTLQSRIVVSDLPHLPQPLRAMPANRYIHPSKDRSYIIHIKSNSIAITMYKLQSLTKDCRLPAHQAVESTARVESLTVLPSTLGTWPEVWLLLGEDYSKPLRLLIQPSKGRPPVMKTLLVSWDELRGRLETTLTSVEESK